MLRVKKLSYNYRGIVIYLQTNIYSVKLSNNLDFEI